MKFTISEFRKLYPDDSACLDKLFKKLGFDHGIIKHKEDIYVDGSISTNTIEGYFGQLKRMISGTHIHVSRKYLQSNVE